MDTTRTERIRLGIFLLICLGLAIGFTVFIAQQQLSKHKTDYYTIFSESVIGLSIDAKVKLNGIEVGNVTDIYIDSTNLDNVVVRFNVREDTPIKTGTRAQMTHGISLTGQKDLVLSGGQVGEQDVPEGGYVPAAPNAITQVLGKAGNSVERIEKIFEQLNKILSDENAQAISNTLKNLEKTSENTNKLTRNAQKPMQEIEAAATSLHKTLDDVEQAQIAKKLETNLVLLQEKLDNVDTKSLNDNLVSALESVNHLSKRADLALYNNQGRLSEVLDQLNAVLANLNDFSQKIKQNPSALIRSETPAGR
ncbi:MAG: MlaD family protein [Fibrobacter sp.]|nr:MlaD family protein [Fibrobacter sp.]